MSEPNAHYPEPFAGLISVARAMAVKSSSEGAAYWDGYADGVQAVAEKEKLKASLLSTRWGKLRETFRGQSR